MDINYVRNIGGIVAAVTSVLPQSSGAQTINGSAIDRFAHGNALSCLLHQVAGAISGAPSTTSVQTVLQHSPDDSTWSNYEPDGVNAAETAALTAQDTENAVAVDLTSANRYVRAVTTVAFTGGTSPTVFVASDVILGGESPLPAA